MYFNKLLNKPVRSNSMGYLCDLLAKSDISLYHYDNRKYWGRIKDNLDSEEIDKLDQLARAWNEKRSKVKNRIDQILRQKINKPKKPAKKSQTNFSYQILPISLMVDMLMIENIKIFDLTSKKKFSYVRKAKNRARELMYTIDSALDDVGATKSYQLDEEVRTF